LANFHSHSLGNTSHREVGFIDRSGSNNEGRAWCCPGPDGCGDTLLSSETFACPSCGKEKKDLKVKPRMASSWDLLRASQVVFPRLQADRIRGAAKKNPDDLKNIAGAHQNGPLSRRRAQIEAQYPNLDPDIIYHLSYGRRPIQSDDKEAAMRSSVAEYHRAPKGHHRRRSSAHGPQPEKKKT
jgi:hypothetical protein